MTKKQYGKITNGQLMKAPSQIVDDGCAYSGVPDAIYRKYGYKPLEFAPQPENIPFGRKPVYSWEETPDTIRQIWSFELLPDDYAEQLGRGKGRFNITLSRLKEGIRNYCEQQCDKMHAVINQDPVVNEAYASIIRKGNHCNIADAMEKYKTTVPCDFFKEIGISEYLRNNGFVINTSGDCLFFCDKTTFYTTQHMEMLNFVNGKVYETKTNKEVYLVPEFAAIKFSTDGEPVVIIPMMIFFALRNIADLYESFHASNLYFTMVFTYLHTAMDDFLSSLIRFYICSYPEGAELSHTVSAAEMLSVNSLEELAELKNGIIDKKIESFGHGTYQDKVKFLINRGLSFTVDKTMWNDDMIWFCEKRNAIIHNAAFVNKKILKKLNGTIYQDKVSLGEEVSPDYDTLMAAIALVETVCNDIYNVARSKFKF